MPRNSREFPPGRAQPASGDVVDGVVLDDEMAFARLGVLRDSLGGTSEIPRHSDEPLRFPRIMRGRAGRRFRIATELGRDPGKVHIDDFRHSYRLKLQRNQRANWSFPQSTLLF